MSHTPTCTYLCTYFEVYICCTCPVAVQEVCRTAVGLLRRDKIKTEIVRALWLDLIVPGDLLEMSPTRYLIVLVFVAFGCARVYIHVRVSDNLV